MQRAGAREGGDPLKNIRFFNGFSYAQKGSSPCNEWVRGQMTIGNAAAAASPFWSGVAAVYAQLDGIAAGYRAAGGALSGLQLQLINMHVELDDVEQAVHASKRADYAKMSRSEFDAYVLAHSHCSAMMMMKGARGVPR